MITERMNPITHTYTISPKVVESCKLNGQHAVTHVMLRGLSHEDVTRAIECSPDNPDRVMMVLLQFALHGIQIEDEPMRVLDPASDDPELRTAEVYKALPLKILDLMSHALMDHLLPDLPQAA